MYKNTPEKLSKIIFLGILLVGKSSILEGIEALYKKTPEKLAKIIFLGILLVGKSSILEGIGFG